MRNKLSPSDTPVKAPIQLRSMQEKDLPGICQLERLCQPYLWPAWFFRRQLRSASCWLLTQQDHLVGFGIITRDSQRAHIMNMCIAPGYRRQGLGRRILLHLLSVAKRQHATKVWLEVRTNNRPAILLYEQLGFRQKQRRKNYYMTASRQKDAIVMIRQL